MHEKKEKSGHRAVSITKKPVRMNLQAYQNNA